MTERHLKSASNQQVSISVKQNGLSLSGDGELIPEVTIQNKDFYDNWYEGSNGKVYITETNNRETWVGRSLPWRENSLGSVPADVAEEIRNHKDDWKLVKGDSRRQKKDIVPITAIRQGEVAGIHEVVYDSDIDTITLRHSAKNRKGLALGALLAAEYLEDRKGYYTMQNLLEDSPQQ